MRRKSSSTWRGNLAATATSGKCPPANDDLVHAATLRVKGTSNYLGCVVYLEPTGQLLYYPKAGDLDECHIDRSGRFLTTFEQIDGKNGVDNRIIDL